MFNNLQIDSPKRLHYALLGVQALLLAPLFFNVLPYWLTALCVLCLLWRFLIVNHLAQAPKAPIKIILIFIISIGLMLQIRGATFSLDATVSLLVAMFVMKSLEMETRRDQIILLFLGFVVIATNFLHKQSLLITVYLLFALLCLLAVLVYINMTDDAQTQTNKSHSKLLPAKAVFAKSGALILQAIPLVIFMMFFIPRLPPLWAVPFSEGQSFTGLSSEMTPGNISKLTRSDALVMRVKFEEQMPVPRQLYWRALVLNDFDGQRWFNAQEKSSDLRNIGEKKVNNLNALTQLKTLGEPINYNVVLESHGEQWLFGLPVAQVRGAQYSSMITLEAPEKIMQRKTYDVKSYLRYEVDAMLSEVDFFRYTSLPNESNKKAQVLARQWKSQTGSDAAYVAKVLNYFNQNNFFYTLEPKPVRLEYSIEDFLLQTREGFCEHYAGAFVFMLRAAGIPARVVTGYQGGKVHADEKLVTVRQFDAHAWAEWWQAGKGWQRVDPTSAIAPNRVLLGAAQSLAGQSGFLADNFMSFGYGRLQWLQEVRWAWDKVNYAWNSWALGFDDSHRKSYLSRWFSDTSFSFLIKAVAISMFAIAAILYLSIVWGQRRRRSVSTAWAQDYQKLNRRVHIEHDYVAAMTPNEWVKVAGQAHPLLKSTLLRYVNAFNVLQYEVSEQSDEVLFNRAYAEYCAANKDLNKELRFYWLRRLFSK